MIINHRLIWQVILMIGVSLAPWMSAAQPASHAATQALDDIVAVVNNDVIVRSELNQEIALLLPQLQANGTTAPPRQVLERQVLDRLISKRLQLQRAKTLGIEVTDEMLTEALTNIAARNNLPLEQLRQALENNGIDFNSFREDTRSQIALSQLQAQEVVKNLRVTDAEINRFLAREADSLLTRKEVRLQHILLALPEAPTPAQIQAAEHKAQGLLKQLKAGEDFAKLAVAHSDGYHALEGGDLGWFPMAEVPSLAVDLSRTLKKGEVAPPFRSPSGVHLIKLMDFRGDAPAPMMQTHARHILLRTNELISDNDARTRLTYIRTRLINGEDFATLARAHSDDTGSALKGGDLGWVNPGDTVPAFEKAMNRLAPNALSEPIKTSFGWHLIQVLERRNQATPDTTLRLKAAEAIRARKAEEAIELWRRRLRDEAYIDIRLNHGEDE